LKIIHIFVLILRNEKVLLTFGGMVLNFAPVWLQWTYQIFAAGVLFGMRHGKNLKILFFYWNNLINDFEQGT
jgi:hypothetical protein